MGATYICLCPCFLHLALIAPICSIFCLSPILFYLIIISSSQKLPSYHLCNSWGFLYVYCFLERVRLFCQPHLLLFSHSRLCIQLRSSVTAQDMELILWMLEGDHQAYYPVVQLTLVLGMISDGSLFWPVLLIYSKNYETFGIFLYMKQA